MKIIFATLSLLLAFPIAASAQEVKDGEALGHANRDVNHDGRPDRIELIQREDEADLYIYLNGNAAPIIGRGIVGSYPTIGDPAHLRIANNGSIIVDSSHIGIGRDKYEANTTIAYRNSQFVIAGYTISHWDSLDPEAGGHCDVNFLSGRAQFSKHNRNLTKRHQFRPIRIQNWDAYWDYSKVCK